MAAPVQFLLHHPYALLFGIVLAEQLGVPLPSVPVLLAAGALAGLAPGDKLVVRGADTLHEGQAVEVTQ